MQLQNKQCNKYAIRNRIRSLRKNKKLSREELLLILKISIQKIVLWKNGQGTILFDELLQLSDFLTPQTTTLSV